MDDEQIRMIPLFGKLSAKAYEKLRITMKTHIFKRKEKVFSENQSAAEVFFLLSGLVRITQTNGYGKEVLLGFRRPKELISASLFNERMSTYCFNAHMLQRGTILSVPARVLEEIVKEEPEVAIQFMKLNQSKMMEFAATIRNLALFDKNKALLIVLKKLAEEYGIEKNQRIEISLPISHQDIANMIAASREHVSRRLSELVNRKIIETRTRSITILDIETLCKMVEIESGRV